MSMVHEAPVDNRTASRTTDVTKGSVLAAETEEQGYVEGVARIMTLQPMSEASVRDGKSVSGIV